MSQYNVGPKTFTAGGTIARYGRCKLSSGEVVVAGADEAAIGVVLDACVDGDTVAVRLFNSGGTFKMIASEAFAVSAVLYGAASGKVTDTDSGGEGAAYTARFIALEAASADGDIVEVLPTVAY